MGSCSSPAYDPRSVGCRRGQSPPNRRANASGRCASGGKPSADTGGMTWVEWTRLEPGQVEAVVGMLVNRERPTSVRITPSRGDGGVDILDRGGADDGGDVVYQVKS